MAHYRKIDTRILLDKKYNQLSSDSRLVFLHLLIHPHLTALGAMHLSLPGLACELDWELDRLRQAIDGVQQPGMVQYDEKARLIWLPNFLKHNPPESPNVVKSWKTALDDLPECALRQQIILFVQQFIAQRSSAYQSALPEIFRLAEEDKVVDQSLLEGNLASSLSFPEGNLANSLSFPEGNLANSLSLPEGNLAKSLSFPEGNLTSSLSFPEGNLAKSLSFPEGNLANSLSLPEGNLANSLSLPEGNLANSLSFPEGNLASSLTLPKAISEDSPLVPRARANNDLKNINNIYINNNNKYINNINKQEEEILQEIDLKQIISIGEEKNIVARKNARQKNLNQPDAKISDVFAYWQQTLGHLQAQLDPKRRRLIKNALSSGYTVTQLFDAIRGCSLTPHNMGENEQGQRYDGLHVILRDADQIDRFIRNSHNPPQRRTKADQLLADNLAAGDRWLQRKLAEERTYDHE